MRTRQWLFTVLSLLTLAMGFSACSSDDDVAVTGVRLDKQSLILLKGASERLTATVTPSDASDTTVTWMSSAPQVASVDASGNVRALAAGSAAVTVTTVNGQYTATCQVTVRVNVSSVGLSESEITIEKGDSRTLTATVLPEDATDKNVSWTSDNISVATVDNNGVVTAVSGGTANISASAGGQTAICRVTVTVSVQGVALDRTSLSLVRGQVASLTAQITPSDATNKELVWSTSDSSVATVADGTVTAMKAGRAVITVTTADGARTATCDVTVGQSEDIGYAPYDDGQKW